MLLLALLSDMIAARKVQPNIPHNPNVSLKD
jgi:hypothetical protein